MGAFLVKTEPSTSSFDDLLRDQRTTWDGVSNPLALIHLRSMKRGDSIVVYHSGKDKAVVGFAEVARGPYPDPKLADPKRVVVDLVARGAVTTPVALATFRADAVLKSTDLVKNSRLSVMPLSPAQYARVLALAGAAPKRGR